MSTYSFSSLSNAQHLAFNPAVDKLYFSASADNAGAVRLISSGSNLGFAYAGKTIWLDGVAMGQLSLTNVTFANGSKLLVGDGTTYKMADWYGQDYSLGASAVGNQVWGLGGADIVRTGSGADYLVGNLALSPLTHVSQVGGTGASTASSHPTVSADGRFVAFDGGWTGFGSSTNNAQDVFVKDMLSGTVTNEHKSAAGSFGLSGAGNAQVSADGQWLAFTSNSSNLVSGNPPSGTIYVASTTATAISAVSTTSAGVFANGASDNADISASGRYVVFESRATNLAANSNSINDDIFVKDVQTGAIQRVSTNLTGGDANADCSNARISADGRFVVFSSAATNLSSNMTGSGKADIYVWDRTDGSLVNITGGIGGSFDSLNPDVAYDSGYGGVVVFQTGKSLVAEDTNNTTDIYSVSLVDGSLQRVSTKADGTQVGLASEDASLSGDGRWLVFRSFSDSLVGGDTNGYADIFVKDLYTDAIALVSRSATSAGNQSAGPRPEISLGGDWIVLASSANNLAGTDGNVGLSDVFRLANPLLKDTLQGGAGNDTYVIARADVITELSNGGSDTVQSSISYALGANLENLTLTGTAGISGLGNSLNNVIVGNAGNNTLNGSSGTDTVSYANATSAVTVSLATTVFQLTGFGGDILSNFENLTGSTHNDRLTGNGSHNRLDGGLGNDTLTGGAGNDVYVVSSSADVIVEGAAAGSDTVISSLTWVLQSTLENLTLGGAAAINGTGNSANNLLLGNAANNILTAAGGNDTLNGGTGNDTMYGGEGSDTYYANSSADVVSESGTVSTDIDSVVSAVSWVLGARLENLSLSGLSAVNGSGNTLNNRIIGNAAANILSGGSGNDALNGGGGNDVLIGGAGSDVLTGSAGADAFVFNSTSGSDTLGDFLSGADKLRIAQSALRIGDGDLVVDGALLRNAPGGFSNTAELVVFSSNLASLSSSAAATAIGSATSAYVTGRTALFVVDNNSASAVYRFTSAGNDALVSASELTLLGTLNGTPSVATTDFLFVA